MLGCASMLVMPALFSKSKKKYIGYPWVALALSSRFWAVLILEHRFYCLLTIVFQASM